MKCIACGYGEMEEGFGRCPKCGFPVLNCNGEEPQVKAMTREYLNKKFRGIKVGIISYTYERKDMELVFSGELLTLFTDDFLSLREGELIWQEQYYRYIAEGREIPITIFIEREGVQERREILFKAPRTNGPWQVGIRGEGGLTFSLAAGEKTSFVTSEIMSIL